MVEEFDVIDAAGRSPDGRTGLMMFEHRDWTDVQRQTSDIQKKTQAYFSYVVDGDLIRDNPEYAGRPVWIRLVCQVFPPSSVNALFANLHASLARHGIEFQVAYYDPKDPTTSVNNLLPIQTVG